MKKLSYSSIVMWDYFENVIPLLESSFYVVCVSYDGFDKYAQKRKDSRIYDKKLEKMPQEEQDYMKKILKLFGIGSDRMAFVKKESVRNQFYSDLVTPLENGISVSGTTVHCFYAVKMGEKYEKRYLRHF